MPKIVRFHETGGAEVLRLEEAALAEPKDREVRLRVEAIGLNRAEVMFRRGQYLEAPELPARLGYEAAGVVEAVGPGAIGVKVGDRVGTIPSFSMNKYGVYGESAIVPAYAVTACPEGLEAVQSAAIWMQYLTAWGALGEYTPVREGDAVLITAASSSVGLAAIQLVKAAGGTAIATTRGAQKKEFLLEQGADHVIVTEEQELNEAVREITAGVGARLAFDPVAGPFLEKIATAMASGGVIYEYGALHPEPTAYPLLLALSRGLTVRGYTLFEIVRDAERLARAKQFVYDGLASGALTPVVDRTFPLESIVEAHRYMESNAQRGKVVVTV